MFLQLICNLRTSSYTKLMKALYNKSAHQVKEVEIPVPWGKIAGKLWGSEDKQPLLALHGWQDNAASFDNVAPLIVKNTPVLAIDLPGHGLSSWLPPGSMYDELVYFLLIKRIKNYFQWEKIKVIAHSLSAMTINWYAAIFPKDLQYVIALDFFKFPSVKVSTHRIYFSNAVNMLLKIEENNIQRSYTEDELKEKISTAPVVNQFEDFLYKILMTRGTTKKEDGTYIINRDPRLRIITVHSMFSQEQLDEFANLITCPYLIIRGDSNLFMEEKEHFYKTLEIFKAANDKVQYKVISATHHLHLTHPKDTAAIIIPFLEKYD